MTLLTAPAGASLLSALAQPSLEARSFLTYKDWPLIFNDDFDSLVLLADDEVGRGWYPRYAASGPDTGGGYFPVIRHDDGTLDWGGYSNLPGEWEQYLDPRVPEYAAHTPFSLEPSTLVISLSPKPPGIPVNDTQWQPYISGALISALHGKGFGTSFGYIEGRIRLPPGYGAWPAFWTLTMDGNWPPEIDVLERFSSYPQDYIATTVHTRSNTPGYTYSGQAWLPDGPPHYQNFYSKFHPGVDDPSNGFHLYGVEWTPDTITYYYDRELVTVMQTPADLKDGRQMYLLLNYASDYNTSTWPDLLPLQMKVDWVRVWGMPHAPIPPIDGPSPWDGEWGTPGASIWDGAQSIWDNG